jgi:glc operon protein GlcG
MLLAHAQNIAEKARTKAVELNSDVAVVILDAGGRLVLAHRMDRASYITTDMGRMKAEVALTLQTPTHVLVQALGQAPELLDLVAIAFEKAALLSGGFPILADGAIIGGLGISGSGGGPVDVAIGEFALT